MRTTVALCLLSLALAGAAAAQSAAPSSPQQILVNPPGTEGVYHSWKYSQAVRVGDTVWVSGQVGMGATAEEQARAAFKRLEQTLAAAGATLADVVELTTFHKSMDDFPQVAKVKDEFMKEGFPAWTAVGTTALVDPRMLVEIRATAVIGSGKAKQGIPGQPPARKP